MEKGYDNEIDLYCVDITNQYSCKDSPCNQLLGHGNLQKKLLCVCHDKAAPTATPLTPYQNSLEENHARNAPGHLQMRHQLLHLKYQKLKPDSFQLFQREHHPLPQENQVK